MKTSLVKLFCFMSLSLSIFQIDAQTNVTGGIYSNTTWIAANSPYEVTGTVVVFEGVSLTIEPGTVIHFSADIVFEVRGTLNANGSASDKIYFIGANSTTQNDYWKGIYYIGTTGGSNQATMSHCVFKNAMNVFDFDLAYHGPYTFNYCEFDNNITVNNDVGLGGTYFDHCVFKNHDLAIDGAGNGEIEITKSVFHDNENGATADQLIENCEFYNHSDRGATVTGADRKMIGCLIHDNVIGVQTHNVSGTQFIDNVVYSNDIGVRMVTFFNDPGILFHSNKICHNTTWDLEY